MIPMRRWWCILQIHVWRDTTASWRIRFWINGAVATVGGAIWGGTSRRGRAKMEANNRSSFIRRNYPLLPLFVAVVTNPDPPVWWRLLMTILGFIRWRRDRIGSAFGAEDTTTEAAVMSSVENSELSITLVTDRTAVVRHPEISRHVWGGGGGGGGLCLSRDPRFD